MDIYKLKRGLKDPLYGVNFLLKKFSYFIPNDKLYLSLRWFTVNHRLVNWEKPIRFTEKLQWLKINYRRPELTMMADKIEVKKYVTSIIGNQFVIPTIAVWNNADEIDFDSLPNQFVLKCNHDSGTGMCICRDKSKLDHAIVRAELNKGLKSNYYPISREWPYKNVPRKVFAEVFMAQENSSDLTDYKWFCFNGQPLYCQVIKNRSSKETIDFFDTNWIHQDFIGFNPRASNASTCPIRPKNLELMIEIAQKLSKNLPFARVDLYEIDGSVFFGEITFFPAGGFGRFSPKKIDTVFGELLSLPNTNNV